MFIKSHGFLRNAWKKLVARMPGLLLAKLLSFFFFLMYRSERDLFQGSKRITCSLGSVIYCDPNSTSFQRSSSKVKIRFRQDS